MWVVEGVLMWRGVELKCCDKRGVMGSLHASGGMIVLEDMEALGGGVNV